MSFTPVPALGSLLRGIDIPPVGGDTMFANMTMAYDALSPGMKRMIADLHGIHTGTRKILDLTEDRKEEARKLNPPIAQPVVRVHPETGKKGALYRREGFVLRHDMTEEESRPLIMNISAVTPQSRNSSIVTNGARTTSSCGTIAAPCISRSATMTTGNAGIWSARR